MRRSTFERALLDPSAVFRDPEEILTVTALTREQKEKLLLSWRQDADRLAGSEVENMGGGEPTDMLDRVTRALIALREGGPDRDAQAERHLDLPAADLARAGSTPTGRPTGPA